METLAKSDIFFFVSTIAVCFVAVFLCVSIFHLLKFIKKMNRISDSIEGGIEKVKNTLEDQPLLHFLFKKKIKTKNKN